MSLNPPPIQSELIVFDFNRKPIGSADWPQPWANWLSRAQQILRASEASGTTAKRPTENLWIGMVYFDTTLGLPIWWDGTKYVKATGAPA